MSIGVKTMGTIHGSMTSFREARLFRETPAKYLSGRVYRRTTSNELCFDGVNESQRQAQFPPPASVPMCTSVKNLSLAATKTCDIRIWNGAASVKADTTLAASPSRSCEASPSNSPPSSWVVHGGGIAAGDNVFVLQQQWRLLRAYVFEETFVVGPWYASRRRKCRG